MNLSKVIIGGIFAETKDDAFELAFYRANWAALVDYAEQLENDLNNYIDIVRSVSCDPFED